MIADQPGCSGAIDDDVPPTYDSLAMAGHIQVAPQAGSAAGPSSDGAALPPPFSVDEAEAEQGQWLNRCLLWPCVDPQSCLAAFFCLACTIGRSHNLLMTGERSPLCPIALITCAHPYGMVMYVDQHVRKYRNIPIEPCDYFACVCCLNAYAARTVRELYQMEREGVTFPRPSLVSTVQVQPTAQFGTMSEKVNRN